MDYGQGRNLQSLAENFDQCCIVALLAEVHDIDLRVIVDGVLALEAPLSWLLLEVR